MGKTSGLAITSMILGIVSLILGWIPILGWIIFSLAIIFGIIALTKISKDENLEGKGMAIAGIVMGAIPLIGLIILVLGIGGFAYSGILSPDKFMP